MDQTFNAVYKLTDNYTATMNKIIRSTQQAQSEVKKASNVMNSLSNSLKVIKSSSQSASGSLGLVKTKLTGMVSAANSGKKAFSQMASSVNTLTSATKKLNSTQSSSKDQNKSENTGTGIKGVMDKLAGMVKLTDIGKKAFNFAKDTLKNSEAQKLQESTFQALLNNNTVGSQLNQYVGRYSQHSALGRENIAKGVTSFLSTTRDLGQIERLINMAERLYAKNKSLGADSAFSAVQEALNGNVDSLRSNYGIAGINGKQMSGYSSQGNTGGMLNYMDGQLNSYGATQAVADSNYNGLFTQADVFVANLKNAVAQSAIPVMENLAGVMMHLNELMQAGKFQPFINLMVNGMQAIGNGIAWVIENLDYIAPVLTGIVGTILIYKGAMMLASLWTAITGATVSALAGNFITAGAIIGGIAIGAGVLATEFEKVDSNATAGLEGFDKDSLAKGLAGTTNPPTKNSGGIPVEVTNSSAIPVAGDVTIEDEDMRYLIDLESQRFFAKFSTATLAPQIYNTFGDVHQVADIGEIEGVLSGILSDEIATCSNGVSG